MTNNVVEVTAENMQYAQNARKTTSWRKTKYNDIRNPMIVARVARKKKTRFFVSHAISESKKSPA